VYLKNLLRSPSSVGGTVPALQEGLDLNAPGRR